MKNVWVGGLPYDDLVACYRNADLFVFPSVWEEPFGMPNIEAMACGVPVIATRSGGIPEFVRHGETGLLVERGDADDLAKAIITVLSDATLRCSMAEAGRRLAAERFTWRRIADDLVKLYASVKRRDLAISGT